MFLLDTQVLRMTPEFFQIHRLCNIEQFGKHTNFPREEYHLIGDSAFPLRSWLITPYSRRNNLTRREKHHNFCLSGDRVCIENTFGILKGRWARLQYINTYIFCQ
jgi:hypothetical protein